MLGAGNPKLKLLGKSWELRAQIQTSKLRRPPLVDLWGGVCAREHGLKTF